MFVNSGGPFLLSFWVQQNDSHIIDKFKKIDATDGCKIEETYIMMSQVINYHANKN